MKLNSEIKLMAVFFSSDHVFFVYLGAPLYTIELIETLLIYIGDKLSCLIQCKNQYTTSLTLKVLN